MKKREKQQITQKQGKKAILTLLILLPLQCIQGGYFPDLYLPFGLALAFCFLICNKHFEIHKSVLLCFIGVLSGYIISAVVHGITVQGAVRIFYIMDILFLSFLFSEQEKNDGDVLRGFLLTVVLLEIIGMLAYMGVPFDGMILADRFMGTYQYANTTAMLFVFSILVTQNEPETEMGNFLLLHYIFLILTGSAGGILLYSLAEIYQIASERNNGRQRAGIELVTVLTAGGCAALLWLARFRLKWGLFTGVLWIGYVFLSFKWSIVCEKLKNKAGFKIPVIPVCLTVIAAGFGYLLRKRAGATFLERVWQMQDAFRVIRQHPLFGIGVGEWERQQLLYRTHDYDVSLIHNSYLQIALEAGIPTLLFLIGLAGCVWRQIRKETAWRKALYYCFFIHLLVDVDFFFLGYMAVVIVCHSHVLSDWEGQRIPVSRKWFVIPAIAFLVIWNKYL